MAFGLGLGVLGGGISTLGRETGRNVTSRRKGIQRPFQIKDALIQRRLEQAASQSAASTRGLHNYQRLLGQDVPFDVGDYTLKPQGQQDTREERPERGRSLRFGSRGDGSGNVISKLAAILGISEEELMQRLGQLRQGAETSNGIGGYLGLA